MSALLNAATGASNKRDCGQCGKEFDVSKFSKNQWAIRKNLSTMAKFRNGDLKCPLASGAFRYVAKGVYTDGFREGKECVCKWFKTGTTFEASYFSLDIKAVDKAAEIILTFNSTKLINKSIKINKPSIWTFLPGQSNWSGCKALLEPFVLNYQKFNSNTGWCDNDTLWPRIMQALSHFSYHISNGQFVLCDLQGGIYADGVILTDPVILSTSKTYGVTDLGPKGISTFFSRHRCNEFCKREWIKPRDVYPFFEESSATSMLQPDSNVPTQYSRPEMSIIHE